MNKKPAYFWIPAFAGMTDKRANDNKEVENDPSTLQRQVPTCAKATAGRQDESFDKFILNAVNVLRMNPSTSLY